MKVGVLALQGDFQAHEHALHQFGVETSQRRGRGRVCRTGGEAHRHEAAKYQAARVPGYLNEFVFHNAPQRAIVP